MKRAFIGFLFSVLLITSGARAADAVALAAQQEAEANYKRLTATIEDYQITQAAQQKRLDALAAEVGKLREEIAHHNNDAANKETSRELKDLREQLQKVDTARRADNQRFQEALEKLGDLIKKAPSGGTPRRPLNAEPTPPPSRGGNTADKPEDFYEYTVQAGDSHLGVIVKRYADEKIIVTSKAIMAANPNVDWSRMKIGQKILIPKPKP